MTIRCFEEFSTRVLLMFLYSTYNLCEKSAEKYDIVSE
jgi:hypothetical protein